eukprot:1343798-Pleurochrysis_carterae.AAC.1
MQHHAYYDGPMQPAPVPSAPPPGFSTSDAPAGIGAQLDALNATVTELNAEIMRLQGDIMHLKAQNHVLAYQNAHR